MSSKVQQTLWVFHGRMQWTKVASQTSSSPGVWHEFTRCINHRDWGNFAYKLLDHATGKILRFHPGNIAKYRQKVQQKDFYSDIYWQKYQAEQKEYVDLSRYLRPTIGSDIDYANKDAVTAYIRTLENKLQEFGVQFESL
jgi:hypothetical protein